MCFDFCKILPVKFPILRIIQRDLITNVYRSSRKVPLILARFKCKLHFLDKFSKTAQVSNFTKISPVGIQLFTQTNRQTDNKDAANRRPAKSA